MVFLLGVHGKACQTSPNDSDLCRWTTDMDFNDPGVLKRSIRRWGILSKTSSAYTDLIDLGYIVASGHEYDLTALLHYINGLMAGVRMIGVIEELFILDALAEKIFGKKAALFKWVGAQYQQEGVLRASEDVRKNFLPYARAGNFFVPTTSRQLGYQEMCI